MPRFAASDLGLHCFPCPTKMMLGLYRLIFKESKFDDFKRLTYWRSLDYGGFLFRCFLKLSSILIGANFKGE